MTVAATTTTRRPVLVFLAALALYAPTVRHRNLGDCGGSSRMATAESLVERGTFAIDGSTFAWTCDRMRIGGRAYSDKPPVLSIAAAGVYAVLHHGFGLRFNPQARPDENPLHDHTYALLTFVLIAVAQALLVASFDAAAGDLGLAGRRRALATAALGLGTILWPLAGLFNPHTVAAALVFAGLRRRFLASAPGPLGAGLALGLAATVDIPLGLLALALAFLAAPARARFVLGALAPLALHAALNLAIVGDLVPFQMHRELYDAETGHAGESATGFAQDAGLGLYAARNLVGSIGVFSLTPALALALVLCAGGALHPAPPGVASLRAFAAVASLLFVAAIFLYVVVWPEAVGCSYGMRHLAPATAPVLLVGAVAAARSRRTWRTFVALAALGVVLAAGGILSPATCAGFRTDREARIPAYVFYVNLRDELWPRLGVARDR